MPAHDASSSLEEIECRLREDGVVPNDLESQAHNKQLRRLKTQLSRVSRDIERKMGFRDQRT